MLPFVNVLPYMQTVSLLERLVWVAAFNALVFAIAFLLSTPEQLKSAKGASLKNWKDCTGIILGLLMFIYASAELSANTFGLLVKIYPGTSFQREMTVVSSKGTGSRYRAIEVELLAVPEQQRYEVTFSKRVFGELPKLQPGDSLRIEGKQNLFGSYIHNFAVIGALKAPR